MAYFFWITLNSNSVACFSAAPCRCDCERRLRLDAEDCKSQLLSKIAFDADVHQQRVNDLEQRLANQQSIVEALNEKLKASGSNDGKEAMTNLIHRLREQMAAEFDKYRQGMIVAGGSGRMGADKVYHSWVRYECNLIFNPMGLTRFVS